MCRPQGAGQHDWELSENPPDEGIQPDMQSLQFRHSYTSYTSAASGPANLGKHASTCTPHGMLITCAGGGGSLQDVRHRETSHEEERKTNSASNLRRPSLTG